MSNRKDVSPSREQPLPLREIAAMFTKPWKLKPWIIYHVTQTLCTPHGGKKDTKEPRGGARYLPSEVAKALRAWKTRKRHPSGTQHTGYIENGVHWIPRPLLRDKSEKGCGVYERTIDRLCEEGLVQKPRIELVEGTIRPVYFWPKEDIDAALKPRRLPLAQLIVAPRTPTEIKNLSAEEYVTLPESESIGFSGFYLRKYTQFEQAKGKKPPKKPKKVCPLIERYISGRWKRVTTKRKQRRFTPTFRLGDLWDIIHRRDNPPVPEGGVLVRDALPKLRDNGISVSKARLKKLIASSIVEGGTVRSFQRDFSEEAKMWWMKWEDRDKIWDYQKPGSRGPYWIGGKDYYPAYESARMLGLTKTQGELRSWTPKELGGQGTPCKQLTPPRTIDCTRHNIPHHYSPHTTDDRLLVYSGADLREIRFAKTGDKLPVPMPPRKSINVQQVAIVQAATPVQQRGRQPLSPKEVSRRLALLDEYKKAHESGARVSMKEFAVSKGISVETLEKYQSWAAMRRQKVSK